LLTVVSSAAACTLTQSLDGLTGGLGGADGGATNDVATDMTMTEPEAGNPPGDGPSAEGPVGDASPDVSAVDASDGGPPTDGGPPGDSGPPSDVVQPDVMTAPVSCADAGVLLCEDFENGLDTVKWPSSDNTNATATIDGTQHHRGAYALHTQMPALSTDGAAVNVAGDITHIVTLPSPVFIRTFVMFSSAPPQSVESFAVAAQSHSPYVGLQVELWESNGGYAMTDWAASPTVNLNGGPQAAAGTWTCIEWELEPPASGTATSTMDFWVDGTEVPNLHLTNITLSDVERLTFGIGFYQVTTLPAYDLWLDDIYVDTSRVGCDK
jgi:hypothetical protein